MKKILITVFLLLPLFGCASGVSKTILNSGAERAEKNQSYLASIMPINGGAAVVVEWNGTYGILTAWHVVSSDRESLFRLRGMGVERIVGPFKRVGGKTDIAWFRMPNLPSEWKPLHVITGHAELFNDCSAWGFPETAMVSMPCIDRGRMSDKKMVCQKNNSDGVFRLFEGVAVPGMSGGPVIDGQGRVFALVSHTAYPSRREHYVCEIPNDSP